MGCTEQNGTERYNIPFTLLMLDLGHFQNVPSASIPLLTFSPLYKQLRVK